MDAARTDDDDPARGQARREWLTMLNDGLIASAGMVEGVAQAGASTSVMVLAGVATVLVGAAIEAGIEFTDAAGERDAREAVIEAERRRIAADPAAEQAELAQIYEAKGLDPDTARRVAQELTARDALAAQLDAEYRLDTLSDAPPLHAAARAGAAFVAGAAVPLVVGALAPPSARVALTAAAVLVALVISATLSARSGRVSPARAVLRTVGVGVLAMLITLGLGSLLDLGQAEVDL